MSQSKDNKQEVYQEICIKNDKKIHLENTHFDLHNLKQYMRQHSDTLSEIIIRNCASNYKRFQIIHTLFLEADLLLIDFANLNKLEVENMKPQLEEENTLYKKDMDSLYELSIKNLMAEFNIHLMLRQNLNHDKSKIVIKQICFDSKHAFYYSLNALLKYRVEIKCVSFVNILDMKINPMKAFCEKIRDLFILTEIQFINVLFSDQNILQIRYLLNWKQTSLERLVFKRIQMSEYQLELLFSANNFTLQDLTNLKKFIFKCDEKLQKCQAYKNLIKKYKEFHQKEIKNQIEDNYKMQKPIEGNINNQIELVKEKDYIKQKLFEPKHIIIYGQSESSKFSSFQKELQQPLKMLLFQLSQSNFCEELDISAVSLIGAPQEIINYLIKAVCDSLSLHTLKIQNCQELIHLLHEGFKQKNDFQDLEVKKLDENKKKSQLAIKQKIDNSLPQNQSSNQDKKFNQNLKKQLKAFDDNDDNLNEHIQSEQVRSNEQLSHRQNDNQEQTNHVTLNSNSFIKIKKKVKRKALKQFIVEGNDHNIFGQSSLNNIIQMMYYSSVVSIDFNDSALTKDGMKGILDGFEQLKQKNDFLEIKQFTMKNMKESNQIDGQTWMKFGQNLFLAVGEYLEQIVLDDIKTKESIFFEVLRGVFSYKVKQMKIKLRSFIVKKKTDTQMPIYQFLNQALQYWSLQELRISSQVDSSYKNNNNNYNYLNKIQSNQMYSHNIRSHQMSVSQTGVNEHVQSQVLILKQEIILNQCSTLKILQLSHFKQLDWHSFIKDIASCYLKLEELDISDNGLNLDFISFLTLNSCLSNIQTLKKLNLSKNPLKTMPSHPKQNQLQNSQLSLQSANLEASSTKLIQPKYQSPLNQKYKINLQNSDDFEKIANNVLKKPAQDMFSYPPSLVEQKEEYSEQESIEIVNSQENHKQQQSDQYNYKSDINLINIDLNKNSSNNQQTRKRQSSSFDVKHIKAKNIAITEEKQARKYDKVMNDFFSYIFKMHSLEYLDLSYTQMSNTEIEMIENQMKVQKESNLNFENINLNGNADIRQSDYFKKKVLIFQNCLDQVKNQDEKNNNVKAIQQQLLIQPKINHAKSITELNMQKCDFNSDFSTQIIEILKLKQCQFRTINLSENHTITEPKWRAIIKQMLISQGRFLENLILSNCKFKDSHIIEICAAVKEVCESQRQEILKKYEYGALQLNLLDLSDNPQIQNKEGWVTLIKTLLGSVLISLRSIILRSCSINNIKSQYLLEGLQEANLELRKNSDICLRCLEQIDLKGNPIPLGLQVDLQKSFLLQNILQSQISQIQECNEDIRKKLKNLNSKKEFFIQQIQKAPFIKHMKPSATQIIFGIESSDKLDLILPKVLKSFSYIDSLIIHINYKFINELIRGLQKLEKKIQKQNQDEIIQNEICSIYEIQSTQLSFRSVTLILNVESLEIKEESSSYQNVQHNNQKKSKFNKEKVKSNSKKKIVSFGEDRSSEGSQNLENDNDDEEKVTQKLAQQINEEEKIREDQNQNLEEAVDLIFNYQKHQQEQIKQKKQKEDCGEYDLNNILTFENQIDPKKWECIIKSLYGIAKFEELIMQNCKIDGRVLTQIGKVTSLISLDVSDNNLLYLIPSDKKDQKHSNNNIQKQAKINPFEGLNLLLNFSNLIELNLSNTNINARFVKQFTQILKPLDHECRSQPFYLTKINLSNNKMLQKQDWQNLIKELINNTCLETLILRDCNLGRHNVQGLINALLYAERTEYLQNIDLSYNKSIYPEEWGIIMVNLFNRYKIHQLNISYCAIYDQKLKNILKNLYLNKIEHLRSLDFSGNFIENPENLFKFMNLLYQASKIEEIKFENCNLNKKNTEYFNDQVHLLQIRTLKTHSSLQIVNFSNNPQILESYCHSYTYFQTFLENSTQYFQNIQEIYLENCLIDQAKINSFIQCFISINSKGLKINSLQTINISGNRILGEQFSEMLPLIIQVASSLQNLYIGFNTNKCQQQLQQEYQDKILDQPNLEFNEAKPLNSHLMNGIQGITAAFKKIGLLQLNKIQVSDDEEVSESDWTEFIDILFEKTNKTLQHIMITGQRKMLIKESMFFTSLHKILRKKRHSNQFLREYFNQKMKGHKIDMQIQSIGYYQGVNQKIFVLTGYIWPSFVKNGFQPELENGNILQLDNQEYDKYFWKTSTQSRNVCVKLHNDMSIMKFEGTIQKDKENKKESIMGKDNDKEININQKVELFIALNYLRKYLNCEQIVQKKIDSKNKAQAVIQSQLFININYTYSKLPIFLIKNVLRAPLQFTEVDLSPILKGYQNLAFDYPIYLFLIQTCNLYPCDSMAEFFVKLIKSLSTYYFSIDQNFFNMIQASPHFFLTEKDRDNIQNSLNKYKHFDQDEEESKLKQQESLKHKNSNQRSNHHGSKQNTQIIQQDCFSKKMQSNKQQNNLVNSFQSIKQDQNGTDSFNRHASNILSNNMAQQFNSNLNQSKIMYAQANPNFSSNQLQQDAQSINNKTQILNEISQIHLIPHRVMSEKQPTQIINQFLNQNQSIVNDMRQSINKPLHLKKQVTKAHIQKLEQEKKFWTVLCPYYFQSESMDGVEEIHIIHRIQKMPPSELELKGMSISAIKTIYAFCFQNPYFTACQMDYNHSVFVNTSLAWSLREKIYRHYCNYKRNPIKNKLQNVLFMILRLMIRENVFYKYDNSAILLDQYYSKKNITLYIMMFLIIVFHILTILVPFIFSNEDGATWDSHFIYGIFCIITFFFELFLVKDILSKILHLTPGFYVVGKSSTYLQACYRRFKKVLVEQTIINYKYLIFFWYLLTSQFSRFNTYSDFCFLVLCWRKSSLTIFYFSCFTLFTNKAISLYRFMSIKQKDELKRKLPGNNITKFYETSIQLDFIAFSEVLDIVSPYNVTRIPNNWLTKLIIPKISGQSMNQRIYYQLLRIIFEDVPQIIIQIIYLIDQIDIYAYISLIMSFISFSLALYKILSIRPSIISQLDFDELKIQKQNDHVMVLKEFEKKQDEMLGQLHKLVENSKNPSSPIQFSKLKQLNFQSSPLKPQPFNL